MDQQDKLWENYPTKILDCDTRKDKPKMERALFPTKRPYSARSGIGEGLVLFRHCQIGSDLSCGVIAERPTEPDSDRQSVPGSANPDSLLKPRNMGTLCAEEADAGL